MTIIRLSKQKWFGEKEGHKRADLNIITESFCKKNRQLNLKRKTNG
jgi:hypothetical protein